MLDETRTRFEPAYEMPVYSGDQILETGLALTSLLEGGIKKARRSNATDNTIFCGISWGEYLGASTTLPLSYTTVVPAAVGGASYSLVPLNQIATSATDMAVIAGAGYGSTTKMTSVSNASNNAAVTDATKFALSADKTTIAVASSLAGQTIFIAQRWAPSALYLRQNYGDMYLPTAAADWGRIGVIRRGEIFTNAYDTSVDWSAAGDFSTANVIRAGANGVFTLNSTGALCRDTTVISVPSANDPWLGLKIEI